MRGKSQGQTAASSGDFFQKLIHVVATLASMGPHGQIAQNT